MRRIVAAGLFALLASNAHAQHRAGSRPGFARSGVNTGVRQGQFRRSGVGGLGYGYGDAFAPYYAGAPYDSPPQPNFSVFQPPPAPVFVEPPPREAQSVIHEYVQPVSGASPQGELPVFGIVLKDGSMRSASAVFVANNVLHYVDTEERNMRVSMDEVDREATRKLNRERKLNLWLPAATASSR